MGIEPTTSWQKKFKNKLFCILNYEFKVLSLRFLEVTFCFIKLYICNSYNAEEISIVPMNIYGKKFVNKCLLLKHF